MATPTIKSKIQLEGGKEFRDIIAENHRELRVFGSELGKVDAQFQGNAKSVEALTRKNEILDRTLVSQKERITLLRTEYEKANQTYGESDRRTQRLAEQLNNAEAAAYKTENAIKANKNQLDNMNTSTVKASDLVNSLAGKFGVTLPEGLSSSIDSIFKFDGATAVMVGGLAAVATAIFTVEKKLIDLTEQQGKTADDINTNAIKYGIDPVTLQEWKYDALFIDTSAEQMFSTMTKLTKSMDGARNGNKELQKTFQDLGIEYLDHNGKLRDNKEVFFEAIDVLSSMQNATERDAAALQIFGKSALDLNPLIVATSSEITRLTDESHALNLIMSEEQVDALNRVNDSVDRYNAKIEMANNNIALKMGPSTIKFNEQLGDLLQSGTELLIDSGFLEVMSAMLDVATNFLPILESTFDLLGPVSGLILKPIALGLAIIADALGVIANLIALIIEGVRWLLNFGQGVYKFDKYINAGDQIFKNGSTARLIRGYASGTDFHPGGLAVVGEEGPELVSLPRGSRVMPNRKTMQFMRGVPAYAGGVGSFGGNYFAPGSIVIEARSVKEFNDITRIMEQQKMSMRQGFAGRG
jgi:hypothetical protein